MHGLSSKIQLIDHSNLNTLKSNMILRNKHKIVTRLMKVGT